MPARTIPQLVINLLGSDYGPKADGSLPDLQQYIDTATPIIDETVRQAALRLTPVALPANVQEIMERWLAAYFYTLMDPTYASKSAGGASGSFIRNQDEPQPYLAGAMNADYSGTLRAVIKRQVAGAAWLGTPTSQQCPPHDFE